MTTSRNSRILRIIPLLIVVCFFSFPAQAQYGGGTGEPNDPYQIATAEDLILLGESPGDYDKHFILTADIDLDPNLPGRKVFDRAVIAPDTNDADLSGFDGISFTGAFDGNNHTISHLTITGGGYLGLFGQLGPGAIISNLALEAVNVNGTGGYVGGLVGYNNKGSITSSYSTGSVSGGESYVGGLVGSNDGSITNSYSTASISGDMRVGGLVGSNYKGTITTSYSTGSVSGNGNEVVGGLVGSGSALNVQYSVWDVETSGLIASYGGVGLTTAEMMDPYMLGLNGFANDPNWILDAGRDYPRLAWEGTAGQIIPEPIIDWLDGQGTEEEPYRINMADQLIFLRRASGLWDKHFILGADIDLDPNLPGRKIFSQAVIQVFSGVFDGNDHTISHLTITGDYYLGLFGYTGSGARISNLALEAVNINGDGRVGGLAYSNGGSISNCYSTGSVTVQWGVVGGLVGSNGGSITSSYSTDTVSGEGVVGGLVGYNNKGSITSSYSTGAVTGREWEVGGLVGSNDGSITSSYSTGAVGGESFVGGLVGDNYAGSITSSYSTGTVSGDFRVGGLVGSHESWGGTRRGIVTMSVWDMETSGLTVSDGGVGLTTAEMQDINSYLNAGWDFVDETLNGTCDYWQISPGDYPTLRYLDNNSPVMPEGLGTAEQPYLIRDARDLGTVWFKPMAHYRLETSLNLSGATWSMAVVPWFDGTFEGNGHVIRNLHIQGGGFLGLFGQTGSGARISNLALEAVNVHGTGDYVGGLVGCNNEGSITSSCSTGSVSGDRNVGGLVGYNDDGTVTNCYSAGTVSGDRNVGGLVGWNGGSITNCYSTGAVTGNENVGGLVGSGSGGTTASFWDTQTSGQVTSAGGTGKTTAEMQTESTFTDAGWDFVDESVNGTEDIWWILEGRDYPRLWWETFRELVD